MRVRASGEHLAGIFETCFVLLLGAILGRSWDDLGSLLGGLGALLGRSWGGLRAVLVYLRPSWSRFRSRK